MRVYKSNYELETVSLANSKRENRKRQGALIKVEFDENLTGYADCHPIAEFGDADLASQLKSLSSQPEPIIAQSLLLAKLDAQARKDNHDLLSGAFLLSNHYLSLDFNSDQIAKAHKDGYDTVKLKMGRKLDEETALLAHLQQEMPRLHWRLDFNNSLSFADFCKWAETNFALLERIEFIEDPFEYGNEWAEAKYRFPIKLAKDLMGLDDRFEHADILVLKPARMNIVELFKKMDINKYRFVITHSMDHFIGQAHAIAMTIKAKFFLKDKLICCGLSSRDLFVADETGFVNKGPHIMTEDAAGIGFDNYLKSRSWELCFED